jgi:hypothetical protein
MLCRSLFVLLFFHLNWPLCSLALCAMLCRSLFVLLFFSLNWPLCIAHKTKEHNGQFKLKDRTNNDLQNIALKTKEHNGQFKLKNRRTNNDLQSIAHKAKEHNGQFKFIVFFSFKCYVLYIVVCSSVLVL